MAYRVPTQNEHFQRPGQKRILTLDGGGRSADSGALDINTIRM